MIRTFGKKVLFASILFLLMMLFTFFTASGAWAQSAHRLTTTASTNYASLVNPFTGTGSASASPSGWGDGDTFPGADAPFGMIQWSPDTVNTPSGGYDYTDDRIKGFSLTHLSGAGCGVFGDIPFMPYVGSVTNSPSSNSSQYVSTFSHSNETAYAGYYSVALDNGVTTQLTTTQRSGAGSFTYPAGQTASLLVNISGSANGVSAAQATVSGNTISGSATSGGFCGAGDRYTIYFWAQFSQSFASTGTWSGSTVTAGATSVSGTSSGVYATFSTSSTTTITVRLGISFVSLANAQANVNQEDPSGTSFSTSLAQSTQNWNNYLSEIQVSGGTTAQTATFYTALYHALLQPNVFSDDNGQYVGFDNQIHTVASGHAQYANFSGWDIYRSEAQLLGFLAPTQASDIAQSMVNDYAQSGQLPKWSLNNAETYVMVGDPADAILADIYAFGGTNFDTATALTAMVKEATQTNNIRPGVDSLKGLGYLPDNGSYGCCNFYGSGSTTLEYDTADFAVGAFAQALGNGADAQQFIARAQSWQNLLRSADNYLEPRDVNGSFVSSTYDPTSSTGWVEGDGAQYNWMVPFNLAGLFQSEGGNSSIISRLNTFFTQLNAGPNSSYAFLGNEPSLETPWEYDYAGAPYQTQNIVRQVENTLYSTGSGGLAGNDDLGEMSSWYVWASMGMFPETPGTANLALSSPLFSSITITRPSGQTITISAPNASASTFYVQSLTVNGTASNNPWLPASFIANGGSLVYTLSTTANTTWGSTAAEAPPSYQYGQYNNVGVSSDNNQTLAGFDNSGFSYSAQQLSASGYAPGATVTVSGTSYAWPNVATDADDNFAAKGQTIALPDPQAGASQLSFLGSATNGPSTGTVTITYTDGTTQTASLGFSDWTLNAGSAALSYSNVIADQMPYRNSTSGTSQQVTTYIFASAPIALNPSKTVASVTLPASVNQGILHVFALSTNLMPAVAGNALNNAGISADGSSYDPSFDTSGYSYSATALSSAGFTPGATVTVNGASYVWPNVAAGTNDNFVGDGQVIGVSGAKAGAANLSFLGSSTNGPSTGTIIITYTDGTTQSASLGFSDWTLNGGSAALSYSNVVACSTSYRNSNSNTAQQITTDVFASAPIALSTSKTVASITLPSSVNQGILHVFAWSIA